jgi:chromate reductase
MGQPEAYLNSVGDAFDEKGELIKDSLRTVLKQYVDAFAAFVEKQNR